MYRWKQRYNQMKQIKNFKGSHHTFKWVDDEIRHAQASHKQSSKDCVSSLIYATYDKPRPD